MLTALQKGLFSMAQALMGASAINIVRPILNGWLGGFEARTYQVNLNGFQLDFVSFTCRHRLILLDFIV